MLTPELNGLETGVANDWLQNSSISHNLFGVDLSCTLFLASTAASDILSSCSFMQFPSGKVMRLSPSKSTILIEALINCLRKSTLSRRAAEQLSVPPEAPKVIHSNDHLRNRWRTMLTSFTEREIEQGFKS